jgi:hypothetical protein
MQNADLAISDQFGQGRRYHARSFARCSTLPIADEPQDFMTLQIFARDGENDRLGLDDQA